MQQAFIVGDGTLPAARTTCRQRKFGFVGKRTKKLSHLDRGPLRRMYAKPLPIKTAPHEPVGLTVPMRRAVGSASVALPSATPPPTPRSDILDLNSISVSASFGQ